MLHKSPRQQFLANVAASFIKMCADDADEQCQGQHLNLVLCITFVFATLFIAGAFMIRKLFLSKADKQQTEVLEMQQIGQTKECDISILRRRLFLCKSNLDFNSAIELADDYYTKRSIEKDDVDKHVMKSLGTNELTAFFYDCIDRSIMIRIGSYFQKSIPSLLKAWTKWKLDDIYAVSWCIVALSITYSDLPKDVLFLYLVRVRVGNYGAGSFPIVIFWSLLASIVASEMVHLVTIMIHHHSTSKKGKVVSLLLAPFMPAFFMFENLVVKLKLSKLWRKSEITLLTFNEEVQKYETKYYTSQLVTAGMKCTENIFENMTLLTILIMMILLSHTKTRAVENIDNIFVESNEFLGYVLAAMSFASIIGGQLSYLKANKNGCLGIKGMLLATPYFVLGTCSR